MKDKIKPLQWAAFSLFILWAGVTSAQQKAWSASQIQHELEKMQVLGSVLYIAAHPDDENTRLISYMANERKVRTAYLSITRGDGGQNLIGPEKSALMGVIRTQELLEARKIDGGEQFFTRAVDFGYSKNSDETLQKWDRDQVLADVVWVMRTFKPDVVITRFPPTSYGGHGHHSASAILAEEAVKAAGDKSKFPNQLKFTEVWTPKRLLFNTSSWWYKDLEEQAAKTDSFQAVDIGMYNPLLGQSYNEIASYSRSQHKSQGFGSSVARGSQLEYVKHVWGDKADGDIFSGVELGWKRIRGGSVVGQAIDKAIAMFNPKAPQSVLPHLWEAKRMIDLLDSPDGDLDDLQQHYLGVKKEQLNELILACAGVWVEVHSLEPTAAYGVDMMAVQKTIVRNNLNILGLEPNKMRMDTIRLDRKLYGMGTPYWLEYPYENMFRVVLKRAIGLPETRCYEQECTIKFTDRQQVTVKRQVMYRWSDRVKGELYRPFVAIPAVTMNLDKPVYVFSGSEGQTINIEVLAHKDIKGTLKLYLPSGWVVPSNQSMIGMDMKKGEKKNISVVVVGSSKTPTGEARAVFTDENNIEYDRSFLEIEYDHIQTQVVTLPATAKVAHMNAKIVGQNIGYITGAGDEVPAALEQLGYTVNLLNPGVIATTDLSQFDAIITGVRAYNTEKELESANTHLLDYVNDGGTMVVQYNTTWGLPKMDIGPYPFKISRDRVTVEEATPTFIDSKHPILTTPNKIKTGDFDGWVQERGLYFANEWDLKFTPIISWNDPGEKPKEGALIVAHHGKGAFIYTGISFFRELPAGVPGAYRLFANIVSYRNGKGS